MILEVDIRKKYDNFSLNVSFTTNDIVTAILGASGCGKSLTLKCIAGIVTPDEGRIVLNGRVLYDSAKKINLTPQERSVGLLFQDYALFPNMTVSENIQIAMGGGMPDTAYFERFHISDIKTLYPHQLSGGQKQRTAMARMLAASPELILLDEPFSALDSYLTWQIENEIKQIIKSENIPALFVSHNRDEVYRLSDSAGVLYAGTLNGVTATKELFGNPGSSYAAIISGCKNVAKAVKKESALVYVPDWNITLETEEVPFENGYIGIRAHSFVMTDPGYGDTNCFKLTCIDVVEDCFEWIISFKNEEGSSWIQWKISKELLTSADNIPDKLWIKKEDILLLNE